MSTTEAANDTRPHQEVVLSQYALLRRIFSNLPAASLYSAARVCKSWCEVAAVTRRDKSRKLARPRVFCWKGERTPRADYDQFSLFESENHQDLERSLKSYLSGVYFEPAAAICVYGGDVDTSVSDDGDIVKSFLVDSKRIDSALPHGCSSVSMITNGVVSSPGTNFPARPFEIENLSGAFTPAAAVALFPKRDDVSVLPFSISETFVPVKNKKLREQVLEEVLAGRLKDASQVKCVVVFTNYHEMPFANFAIQEIARQRRRKVAIGGGVGHFVRRSGDPESVYDIAEDVAREDDASDDRMWVSKGLIFAGEGVEAASVRLKTNDRSVKVIEARLSELKSAGMDEAKSCAFMFACCGRGRHFHKGKRDVESDAFRRLFPNTQLMGFFGGGEVGVDYVPKKDEEKDSFSDPAAEERARKEGEKLYTSDDLLHSFSTVFVLLSFK